MAITPIEAERKSNTAARPWEALPALRPPYSLEAEQALLGALLINNQAAEHIPELTAAHFFDGLHGNIFDAMSEALLAGRTFTATTLAERFRTFDAGGGINGAQYLGRLMAQATTIVNVREYARTIIESAQRRQLIVVAEDLSSRAFDPNDPATPAQLIEDAERQLFAASIAGKNGQEVEYADAIKAALEEANKARMNGGKMAGLSTGFIDVDAKLGGMSGGNLIIIAGRPSMGKAQPLDALVRTTTGWKPMGEIQIGERLKSIDGRQSFVSGVFPQGVRPVYRVTFSDGRSTRCCGEHLWRVHYRDWAEPRVLSTDDARELLRKSRYVNRLWIDMAPATDWGGRRDVALPIDPWVLGAIIGDGGLSSGVRFTTASDEILQNLTARLGETSVIAKAAGSKYDYEISQWGRSFDGSTIVADMRKTLRSLGLMGCRSYEKFIPREYLDAPPYQRIQLLRGLLDTDGWIEKHGSIRISTASPQLALDIQELARSLGAWCSRKQRTPQYSHNGETHAGRTAYTLTICHPNPKSLFTVGYKVDRAHKLSRRKMPTFAAITPDGEAECQCISVTHKSRLYFTDDYVVTHNTALAMNIAGNVAETGDFVHFFSMEMSPQELANRQLGEFSGVPSDRLRRGDFSEDEFRAVAHAARKLSGLPCVIDRTGGISISSLATKARRMARKRQTKLIVIDYLQLMSAGAGKGGNRVQDITEITTGLKALAAELQIPIIALSQLSRGVENRPDKRPMLSDLRESGSIEQDADVVMFVFREEYYVERSKPAENDAIALMDWQRRLAACAGKAEVIIGKQRHGAVGIVEMAFEGALTRFSDLARGVPDHG
jgi:replicative DNA helicase